MDLRQVESRDLKNRKVLVRVDFNVPFKDGKITDSTRISAHKPTIDLLRDSGAKIALVTHFGRPGGKRDEKFSTRHLVNEIQYLYGMKVRFVDDVKGQNITDSMQTLENNELILLENIRFNPEEKKNDKVFATELGKSFDLFIMDAFSACHRAHASTNAIQQVIPSYAGLLLKKEVDMLGNVKEDPEKPFTIILGGAKVSDKIGVIESLMDKASSILIGGGMAFTFLKASGRNTGNSIVEEERIEYTKKIMSKAKDHGVAIVLPVDFRVGLSPEDERSDIVDAEALPDGKMGLDIGPVTSGLFKAYIENSRTVLWNGPLGVFENPVFESGTHEIADFIANQTDEGKLFSVIGGGDSAAAVKKFGLADRMSHVSTGGGASLEFFEKDILPGIKPLIDQK